MFDEPLISSKQLFSVELISNLLFEIKNGKAVGLDDLSCEHLKYSDPIVSILCKLINFLSPMVTSLIVSVGVIWCLFPKVMCEIEPSPRMTFVFEA